VDQLPFSVRKLIAIKLVFGPVHVALVLEQEVSSLKWATLHYRIDLAKFEQFSFSLYFSKFKISDKKYELLIEIEFF
jgi:hypothetical protein